MQDFSIAQKIKILNDIVISSPAFFICFFSGLLILLVCLLSILLRKKISKYFFFSIWVIAFVLIIIVYHKFVFNLFDNLFNNIFTAIYFPNLAVYSLIIIVSNGVFIYSLLNKKVGIKHKIINSTSTILLDILLLLIIDIVTKNNINVYEQLTVYSNSNLLVLLELSTAIFTSWMLLNLLISAHSKLKIYDEKKSKEIPEIIFD